MGGLLLGIFHARHASVELRKLSTDAVRYPPPCRLGSKVSTPKSAVGKGYRFSNSACPARGKRRADLAVARGTFDTIHTCTLVHTHLYTRELNEHAEVAKSRD